MIIILLFLEIVNKYLHLKVILLKI